MHIDSPEWIRNKKATTTNLENNDDKCFQYALTFALSHKNIKNNMEIISKNKYFIDKCDWKEIIFPPCKKDGRKFELNGKSIAVNVLFTENDKKNNRIFESIALTIKTK